MREKSIWKKEQQAIREIIYFLDVSIEIVLASILQPESAWVQCSALPNLY